MTIHPRTTRILEAIPNGPALFPYWYWPVCPKCQVAADSCDLPDEGNRETFSCPNCEHILEGEHAAIWKPDPLTEGPDGIQGGDLTREENLHLLVRIATSLKIENLPCRIILDYRRMGNLERHARAELIGGTASDPHATALNEHIHLALTAAIEEALGLEVWK